MPPPKLVNIDPIGNLLIISKVPGKPTPYHFRVSSKILSLASPLFASLFPSAASHTCQYQLIISDDVPETVGTLLELCHFGRTAPLPYAPLKGLFSLAELSQKYAIVSPLVPWISIWAEPLHTLSRLDFSKGDDLQTWLTVACVYNQGPLFVKITRQAILTGSAEILDVSRWQYPYSEIIEKISPERIDVLSRLTAIALTLLGRYQITDSICKQPTNSKQCDAILLGSVLKGLMGLGVYQPIPESPYPGMTVMDLADKIENFPFMCDAAHEDTCGVAIKEEMKNTMKLMAEILSEVNGLELKNFKFKKGWGQVEGMVVTTVGDLGDVIQQSQRQQGHKEEEEEEEEEEEVVARNQVLNQVQDGQGGSEHGPQKKQEEHQEQEDEEKEDEKEDEREDEEQEVEEQKAEEQGQVEGGGIEAKTQVENGDEDGDLPTAVVTDTAFENESGSSEMSEVPAGVMDGFLETEETMQDFGPRKFFDDVELDPTRDETHDGGDDQKSVIESPLVGNSVKGDENEEVVVANPRSMEDLRVERDKSVQYHLIQEGDIQNTKDMACLTERTLEVEDSENPEKQKEQLRPEAKDFIPSFPLGPAPPERNRHHMPRSRRDMARPPRPAETLTHMASRANAEAKGQQWETPGPALVRKYQRGSRIPFHPEVTVRDVSDPDHIARVKSLKERFPQLDNKIVFECLRQNNWNLEETAKVLGSGRIQMGFSIDSTVRFPVLEPTILHTQKPVVSSHQVSPETSTTNIQYPGDSAAKPPHLEALEAHREAPKAQNNTTSVPQPVSSVPTPSVTDSTAHFWPPADSATVLRAVKLPENSLTIRKLLAIFPSARADKSFIDVLYRSGWDLEQAAKRLEGLGLVRKANSGDAGDAGKLKGKGKAKAKGEVK